jgi:hypothetical protein
MGRVFFDTRKNVHSLTAAYVVLPSDSGKVFTLNAAAGAGITLPSVADAQEGWNCRFIVGTAFATTDWIITATAAIMVGGMNELEVDTADDGPSTVAGTTINIEFGAETIGDYIDMVVADGKIYISGQSKLDGAFTIA